MYIPVNSNVLGQDYRRDNSLQRFKGVDARHVSTFWSVVQVFTRRHLSFCMNIALKNRFVSPHFQVYAVTYINVTSKWVACTSPEGKRWNKSQSVPCMTIECEINLMREMPFSFTFEVLVSIWLFESFYRLWSSKALKASVLAEESWFDFKQSAISSSKDGLLSKTCKRNKKWDTSFFWMHLPCNNAGYSYILIIYQ